MITLVGGSRWNILNVIRSRRSTQIIYYNPTIMKRYFLWILLCVFSLQSAGQRRTVMELPFNPEMRKTLANSLQYLETDFLMGNISLKDGTLIPTLMNYNILFDELHFVMEDEDTGEEQIRAFTNFDALRFVTIGRRMFIHDRRHGFLEVLVDGDHQLVKKSRLELKAEDRSRDGYGYLPESSSIQRIRYLHLGNEDFLHAPDREKIIEGNTIRTETYFSLSDNSLRMINNRRSIQRMLPRAQRNELEAYMGTLEGRWDEEKNLVSIFQFINQ